MTALTFATASTSQRIQMIEEALEKVLDLDGIAIEGNLPGDGMYLWVAEFPGSDNLTGHSLYGIAREMEVLLS